MSPLSVIHIGLMVAAFLVFAASFVVGLVYLVQEDRLKSHDPRLFLSKLPPLEVMDAIHYKTLTVGFLLLSVGILVGAVVSKKVWGRFFTGDPREVATLAVWGIYAFFLNVRIRAGWRGRRGIALSILGFVGVVLAFLGLQHRGF